MEGGDLCLRKTTNGVDLNRNWGYAWAQVMALAPYGVTALSSQERWNDHSPLDVCVKLQQCMLELWCSRRQCINCSTDKLGAAGGGRQRRVRWLKAVQRAREPHREAAGGEHPAAGQPPSFTCIAGQAVQVCTARPMYDGTRS